MSYGSESAYSWNSANGPNVYSIWLSPHLCKIAKDTLSNGHLYQTIYEHDFISSHRHDSGQ